jgi:murein L,D-transpeptidase YafK
MQFRITMLILATLTLLMASLQGAKAADESKNATPAVSSRASALTAEFEAKGLKLGSPVFLRVYKQSSELELWVQRGPRYALLKTFEICRWSGGLGPKMFEGDRQSPEGLYHITSADLIINPRWDRAMNINYPNSFDVLNGRSGSGILIHGKCASIGCFAIRDENVEEVFEAVRAALAGGQTKIPVLSLPFRFRAAAPSVVDTLQMNEFWTDLRRADLLFERDKLPPTALLCDGRYFFADRRGDRHRHAVHTPGCSPLEKRITPQEAAELAERKKSIIAAAEVATENSKEVVENAAQNCDPNQVKCRLLRVAVKSNTICPKKYGRCHGARAAYTKSVECPLKYPRCRRFLGPDPHKMSSASRSNILRVKR